MARPRKKIDADQVQKLAALALTTEEIGAVLGCSADTLERRFAGALKDGRLRFRASLKRLQFRAAQKGSAALLIWLGKVYLGQREPAPAPPPETETFGRAFAALRHRRAARDAGRSDDPIEAN